MGYSASYLKSWARSLIWQNPDAERIAASAVELSSREPRAYEVLIALNGVPHRGLAELVDTWRGKRHVIEWLTAHKFDTVGIRTGGGFVYTFQAQDPYMAAEQARQMLERMVARSSFLRSGRGGVTPLPHLWVAGHKAPINLQPPARSADVLTLVHEEHLYRVHGERSQIDDALELAAPINQGPLAPAVTGAWAAIESLLSHPGDSHNIERSGKAISADRFAALIACSWPRAELSTLAHRHSPATPDALSRDISRKPTNREKARVIAEVLLVSGSSSLKFGNSRTRDSDRRAAERMTELVGNPRKVLGDATTTFTIAMRRLYRARNIVLHGGAPQGVAVKAALRAAAPLVGAGLD